MQNITLKVRGFIMHEGKLLVFPAHADHKLWSLPGGKMEFGETIESALKREIIEETAVTPVIGRLLAIQELTGPDYHSIEFFYEIKNGTDFISMNIHGATHGFEVLDHTFADPHDAALDIRPEFAKELAILLAEGKELPVPKIYSYTR
jgi:ADP-ribose pyrophosphatase YjhB (NUDIX family)